MERLIVSTVGLAFGLITALIIGFEIYKVFSHVGSTLKAALTITGH